jgi:hypothetical protein
MSRRPKRATEPTEENDDTWPIGLLPGGNELNEVDPKTGDSPHPTEENE